MRRAQVWQLVPTASLNLLAGPSAERPLRQAIDAPLRERPPDTRAGVLFVYFMRPARPEPGL